MRIRLHTLLLITLLVALSAGRAGAQQFLKQGFVLENDQPGFHVNRMIQDSRHLLWLATSSGLYHFDGRKFQQHALASPEPDVTCVYEDNLGLIWAGTASGRLFISSDQGIHFDSLQLHTREAVLCIYQDRSYTYWLGTNGDGLYSFNVLRGLEHYWSGAELNDDYVYSIIEPSPGTLWLGTDRGINIRQPDGRFRYLNSASGLKDNLVQQLFYDALHGQVLAASPDRGISRINVANDGVIPSAKDDSCVGVTAFVPYGQYLLAATNYEGLLDCSAGAPLWHTPISTEKEIRSAIGDAEGNVWLGSGNELVKVCPSLSRFSDSTVLSMSNVQSVRVSDDGNQLFFGADHGIGYVTRDSNRKIIHAPMRLLTLKPDAEITALYNDRYQQLWIGTLGHGLLCFNMKNRTLRRIQLDSSVKNEHILSISGGDTLVWVSSLSGVYTCTTRPTHTMISPRNETLGLKGNYVYKVLVDSRDRIWLATDGHGLRMVSDTATLSLDQSSGLKNNVVYDVVEDRAGNIWFCCLNGGAYRYNGKQIFKYSTENGLSDNAVTLLAASGGNILLAHKKGIDSWNTQTQMFSNLMHFAEWGIRDVQNNCLANDPDGLVWLGTNKGLFRIRPEALRMHTPVVVLQSVKLNNEKECLHRQHTFSAHENNFTFRYTGIWNTNPESVQYAFKLDGYNDNWIPTSDEDISLSQLPPGHYVFRVKAFINNQSANVAEARYEFDIAAPFWQTPKVIIGALLLAALLIWWVIRWRISSVRKVEALKKEKLQLELETLKTQINPHFVFNSFNTLMEMIEASPDTAGRYAQSMADFFRSVMMYRNKDVIGLDEEMVLMDTYLYLQQQRFGKAIRMERLLGELDTGRYKIPPLTMQLLLENAIKHNAFTLQKPLVITLMASPLGYLVVRNNKQAKSSVAPGTGTGLSNIRNRYRLLHISEIEVVETESFFEVRLPLIESL